MDKAQSIVCMSRNGHWFYFRWDADLACRMLWHAYLQAVDPHCKFDLDGLRTLKHEIDTMPEDGMRESVHWDEPSPPNGNPY